MTSAPDKAAPQRPGADSVTMADVAAAAGVSKQTVSNVLNYPEKVRPKTRERVEQAVDELGFQPNRLARALKASSTGMIACRIEPLASQTLASLHDRFLHALVEAGQPADRHVMLFAADDPEHEVATCIRLWRTGAVDGVVIYGLVPDDERPAALVAAQVPFVCFGRVSGHDGEVSWVDVDNTAGMEMVVDHLVAAGHRRIGFLGFPDGHRVSDDRAHGWVSAMDRHGLLVGSHRLDIRGEDTWTAGARMARGLLQRADAPTALVAVSDTLAAGALHAVRDMGMVPGEQVALVGYDDTPSAEVLELSSVRQPLGLVGVEIMGALFPAEGSSGRMATSLEPELIVRSSSRRAV